MVWNEQPAEAPDRLAVWVGTPDGVQAFDAQTSEILEDQPWAGVYTAHDMIEDSQGVQWVGTSAGLGRFDGVTWEWVTTDAADLDQVLALVEDLDETLWFCTQEHVVHYDALQSEAAGWTATPLPGELASAAPQAIAIDLGGRVWVGTTAGLATYNGATWEIYGTDDGLASENVTALAVDSAGVLWIGTDAGLLKWTGEQGPALAAVDGLTGAPVTALAVDRLNGFLWLGTESGLARYDGRAWQTFRSQDGLPDERVTALAIGTKGTLWVGMPGVVARLDGEQWTSYAWDEPLVTALAEDAVANAMCPRCMDVFYRRSEDGGNTWSSPFNLSRSYAGSVKPQIALGADGEVHVVWDEGEDWYLGTGYPVGAVVRSSADSGATWSAPFTFSHPDGAPQQITLNVGPDSQLVAVWRLAVELPQRSPVYYQLSEDDGASWSEPAPIEGIIAKDWLPLSLDTYHSDRDGDGNVHLLMVGYLGPAEQDLSVIHTVWDGQEWSAPYGLFTAPDPPEWPRIAVDPYGDAHATWFTRDLAHIWDSERGRYQVWGATRLVDSAQARWTPAPATPSPSTTLTLTPTPSAAPPTADIPNDSAPPRGLYTDIDDALRLLLALAPVAAALAAAFIVRRLRAGR
jgi:hypothetical protein